MRLARIVGMLGVILILLPSCVWGSQANVTVVPSPRATASLRAVSPTMTVEVLSPFSSSTCTIQNTSQIVTNFVEDFNLGDMSRVSKLFPEASSHYLSSNTRYDEDHLFQVFSISGRGGGFAVDNRDDLLAKLARLHSENVRWELRSLAIGESLFQFSLTQYREGIPSQTFIGKGHLNCTAGWITVWAMSTAEAM